MRVTRSYKPFLIFNFLTANQSHIRNIIENFPRLRDLHGDLPQLIFIPKVHVANILALSTNTTLISALDQHAQVGNLENHTTFHPGLFAGNTLKTWHYHSSQTVNVRQVNNIAYNFAYCGIPRIENERIYFIEFFDWIVWIYLVMSAISVSIVTKLYIAVNQNQPAILFEKTPIAMATLSILLTPGLSSGGISCIKYSKLFSTWMLCSLILVTYYTGAFTSEVIEPPECERMTKVEHLLKHDYSLVFRQEANQVSLKLLTNAHRKLKSFAMLEKFLGSSTVQLNTGAYLETLTNGSRYATLGSWMIVISEYLRAVEYITRKNIKTKQRCYLGKELAFPEGLYAVLISSKGNRVAKIFDILLETGIYQAWHAILYKKKRGVQGSTVVTVVSPTKVVESKPHPLALTLEGKLRNGFIVWSILLSSSLPIFIIEVVRVNVLGKFNFLQKLHFCWK